MNIEEVRQRLEGGGLKARVAVAWCRNAAQHAEANGGKPWSYLLMPHAAITASSTLSGLTASFRTAYL